MTNHDDPLGLRLPMRPTPPPSLPHGVRHSPGGVCWWCGAKAAGSAKLTRRNHPTVDRIAAMCLGCWTGEHRTWRLGWRLADTDGR
jgi:hypothetical protein